MSKRIVMRREFITRHVVRRVGLPGKSAYQSYLETTEDDPPMTEEEWSAGGGGGGSVSWNDITGKPSTFPTSANPTFESVTFSSGSGSCVVSSPGGETTVALPSTTGTLAVVATASGVIATTDIGNSGAAGRAVLEAATEAAARSAIGLPDMSDAAVIDGTVATPGASSPAQLKLAAQTWGGSSGVTHITLAADTAARNSGNTGTTYTNESGMTFPSLKANKAYRIEWSIPVSAGAGGVKLQLLIPSCKAGNAFALGYYFSGSGGAVAYLGGSSPRTMALGVRAADNLVVSGFAIIHVDSTGGAPVLQWAQNSSNAADTKLLAGAVFTITPLFTP